MFLGVLNYTSDVLRTSNTGWSYCSVHVVVEVINMWRSHMYVEVTYRSFTLYTKVTMYLACALCTLLEKGKRKFLK